MDYWEGQAEEWKYKYYKAVDAVTEARKELSKTEDKLSSAEYKIDSELKPRIESEQRSYDNWALNGGGDACMQNGMSGNCGFDCSAFGEHDSCSEIYVDMSDKELLKAYEDGYNVEDEIDDRELNVKKFLIDIKSYREDITSKRKTIRIHWKWIFEDIVTRLNRRIKR